MKRLMYTVMLFALVVSGVTLFCRLLAPDERR